MADVHALSSSPATGDARAPSAARPDPRSGGARASRGPGPLRSGVLGCWRLSRRRLPMAGSVTPERLVARLERLAALGVRFISFEEFRSRPRETLGSRSPEVLLTFDHPPAALLEPIWPLLLRLRIAPVIFVTTGAVGRRGRSLLPFGPSLEASLTWGELTALAHAGASIQCHGHTGARLTELPPEISFGDMMRSRREVELRMGSTPIALSYPGGACDAVVADLAAKAGFEVAFTRARRARSAVSSWPPALSALALPRENVGSARLGSLAARQGEVAG